MNHSIQRQKHAVELKQARVAILVNHAAGPVIDTQLVFRHADGQLLRKGMGNVEHVLGLTIRL